MPRTLLISPSTQHLIESCLLTNMSDSPVKKAGAGAWTDADRVSLLMLLAAIKQHIPFWAPLSWRQLADNAILARTSVLHHRHIRREDRLEVGATARRSHPQGLPGVG